MRVTRREVLQGLAAVGASAVWRRQALGASVGAALGSSLGASFGASSQAARGAASPQGRPPLDEFGYDQVEVRGRRVLEMQAQVTAVLMGLNEDSLLQPFRQMAGRPAPGKRLGGWYEWKRDFDFHHDDAGFAPASTFGQWTSAMARLGASARAEPQAGMVLGARAVRLHGLLREAITPEFFAQTRFAAYTFDKLVCGLVDGHVLAADSGAFETLARVTEAAQPSLPGRALDRELQWAMGKDQSYMWDESYTMPENLYRAAAAGAGEPYRRLAREYLEDDSLFAPLARGENVLADRHAYSYTNALCSAMQAYLVDGSAMHLQAAVNAFAMIEAQSFVTGGWGPDELFRKPGYGQLAGSLTKTHNSFEVPCGSFAHLKLTRYLLRATGDGRYGDSMERVVHNALLGAMPLEPDGRSFYYADYNVMAKRVYSDHRWPCCSGTLPQVLADLGINGYLREPGAVWVNLYQASVLRWREGANAVVLEQTGNYPEGGQVSLRFARMDRPTTLALRLRIPAWAGDGARLTINGDVIPCVAARGFATVEREWRAGDLLRVELPMTLRLEALPAEWAPMRWGPMPLDTVALLRGPEVLFAIREPWESGPLSIKLDALLEAEQTGRREWMVRTPLGPRRLVPWTEIGDRMYTTYLKAL